MTSRRLPFVLILPALLLGGPLAQADPPATQPAATQPATRPASLFDPDLHLRTADVEVGMKGYGLSVFKGTEIERFEVEVLAILSNSEQLDTDVILIRCSGANLEHTGPIAGMSGSPIYLRCDDGKDRLVGAFAFGWPGSKDPIAGVQPIEKMLALNPVPEDKPDFPNAAAAVGSSAAHLSHRPPTWNALDAGAIAKLHADTPLTVPAAAHPAAAAGGMQLRSLALPFAAGGFTSEALSTLQHLLAPLQAGPLLPLDAAGVAGSRGVLPIDTLAPGSTLVVPILTGDLNLIATGTCTTVIDDRVFGFGHPLLSDGRTDLPLAAGAVSAVIPTQTISFKLGAPGQTVGTLATDATSGIAGSIGPVPETAPVRFTVVGADGASHTYHFSASRHSRLTAVALASAAQSAAGFFGSPDPQGSTRWDISLRFTGDHTLRLSDIAPNNSGLGGSSFVMSLLRPLMSIANNPFDEVALESVEATIHNIAPNEMPAAEIVGMSLPRTRFRAGETVEVLLSLQLQRGQQVTQRLTLTLPDDLPAGEYPLSVTDSVAALLSLVKSRPFDFEAHSIDDVFSVLSTVQEYPSDAVYLRLDLPEEGSLAVGRQALPQLPKSRAALLTESGRSDVVPFTRAITKSTPLPYVLSDGAAKATITVVER